MVNKTDWTKELYYIEGTIPFYRDYKIKEISKSLNCYNSYKYDYFKTNKGKNYYGKKRRSYADYS